MTNYKIRTAAKALIEENEKILLIKHKRNEIYYTLPGGGQRHNEELKDSLHRECLEELGAEIIVKDLAFVFEYIAAKHPISIQKDGFHQIDIAFECKIENDRLFGLATETDETQIGYEWINISELTKITMYPMSLREEIYHYYNNRRNKIYLGEIE